MVSNDTFVFIMNANPNPNIIIAVFDSQGSVITSCSN